MVADIWNILQFNKYSHLIRVNELCHIQFWTQEIHHLSHIIRRKLVQTWDRDRKGWRTKTTSKRSMLIKAIKLRSHPNKIKFVRQSLYTYSSNIFERWKMQQLAVEFFSKLQNVAELWQNWKLNASVSRCKSIIGINLLLCKISGVQSTICKSVVQNEINSFKIDHIQKILIDIQDSLLMSTSI